VLLAYTGMRIREALGLRWEDVDPRSSCGNSPRPGPVSDAEC
jgi:integrase